MIYDVKGCSSCPFLDDNVMLHDSRGHCTLEYRTMTGVIPEGRDRHRLAAIGEPHLVPLKRTPCWCPLRGTSVTVTLRKRGTAGAK